MLAHTHGSHHSDPGASFFTGAIVGMNFGLVSSIIAAAVKGAGAVIDSTLGSPPFLAREGHNGVVERLYDLAFAITLLASGGFTVMIQTLVRDDLSLTSVLPGPHAIVALAGLSLREGFMLAGPCLFAQGLATMAAGILTRCAPALSGVQFGTSLSSAFALLALTIGASTLAPELAEVVRETVSASARTW